MLQLFNKSTLCSILNVAFFNGIRPDYVKALFRHCNLSFETHTGIPINSCSDSYQRWSSALVHLLYISDTDNQEQIQEAIQKARKRFNSQRKHNSIYHKRTGLTI